MAINLADLFIIYNHSVYANFVINSLISFILFGYSVSSNLATEFFHVWLRNLKEHFFTLEDFRHSGIYSI